MADPKLNIKVTVNGAEAQRDLGSLSGKVDQFGNVTDAAGNRAAAGFGKARAGVESISTQLDRAQSAAIGFFGAQVGGAAVQQVAQLADSYNNLQARIKLAAGEGEDYLAISQQLFDVAQRTQVPLQAIGDLYSRTAGALRDAGLSTQQAIAFTETLAQSFRVSGTSAQESNAAIIQLAQGLSAGALRGDEFNSVAEQSPRLLQALSEGLDVSRGELRKMAEQGQLTAEVITSALQSQSAAIAAEYAQLPQTIDGALTQLRNELQRYVGETGNSLGATDAVAAAIKLLADNVEVLDQVLAVAAAGGAVKLTLALQAQAKAALESIAASKAQAEAAIQNSLASREVAASELAAAEGARIGSAASYEKAAASQASARAGVASAEANLLAARSAFESAAADLAATTATEARVVAERAAFVAGEQVLISEKLVTAAKKQSTIATTELDLAIKKLVISQNAEAVAAGRSAAAQQAAAVATGSLLKELGTLSGVLNVAFAGFIGFEIGSYLRDEFETARIAGARLTQGLLVVAETARFAFDVLSSPLDAAADYDQYVANLRRISSEFDQIAADATNAAIAQQQGAVKAGAAQEALKPKIDAVAEAIKAATGQAVSLGDAGGKAGEGLSKLTADNIISGIATLEGQVRAAKDELEVFEGQMDSLTGEAFIEFEAANRDAFDKAVGKVRDLEAAITALRTEQFARLGIDTQAVLTGIDAKARGLIDTFGSLSSDASTDLRLVQAAAEAVLKKLDTPQEIEAFITSLQRAAAAGQEVSKPLADARQKLVELQQAADPAAKALEEAFKTLGIVSTAALQTAEEKAKQAFETIRAQTGEFSRQSAAGFQAYADAAIKAAAAQGEIAFEAEVAGLRITAAGFGQIKQLEELADKYRQKGDAAEDSSNRSQKANQDEDKTILQLIQSKIRLSEQDLKRIQNIKDEAAALREKNSLVNDPDRINDLSGVNVATAGIDGVQATGFGFKGIERLREIEADIARAIKENTQLLDQVRGQQVQSENDVRRAQGLLVNASVQSARLATVTGADAPQARALGLDLERQVAALRSEIVSFRNKPATPTPSPGPGPLPESNRQSDVDLQRRILQAQADDNQQLAALLSQERAQLLALIGGSPSPSPAPAPSPSPAPRITPPTTPERVIRVEIILAREVFAFNTDPLSADNFLRALADAQRGST